MLRPLQLCLATVSLACFCMGLSGCPSGGSSGTGGAGGGEAGKKRIVILTNGDDPFWDACEAGAMKAEEVLGLKDQGYYVTFDRADFTDKGQVDKVKQYAMQKDLVGFGISVFNPDSAALAKELKALRDRGVKVITIDGEINRDKYRDARFGYIGTDNIIAGRELGKAAKAILPDGGKYAFFVGNTGAANAILRMQGFKEGFGEIGVEAERLEDRSDLPTARKNVQGALDRHSDLNALVGIWAYNTPQIVAEVKDRNIRDKVKIFCFDAAEASIAGMRDNFVDVMVVQNPYQMGMDGVRLLKALVEDDQETIKEFYPNYAQEGTNDLFATEVRVIVPDSNSPVKKENLEPETIFMELKEFEEWLKERKLQSS